MENKYIRRDDFNIIIRDRYYVKLSLDTKNKSITFSIFFIDVTGENSKEEEIAVLKTTPEILLHKYITIIEAIFVKNDTVSEQIINDINEGLLPSDEIDYPNEYTMWHSNWYKHSYTFLQPFHTLEGAKLRLSYLINELIIDDVIERSEIILDDTIKKYKIDIHK